MLPHGILRGGSSPNFVPLPGSTDRGHNVFYLSVRPSVRYQTYEHDVLKRNEPIWCQFPQQLVHEARKWSVQLWGSWGQRSRSYETDVRFGKMTENARHEVARWSRRNLNATYWYTWYIEFSSAGSESHSPIMACILVISLTCNCLL